jgi:hypothetical protein
LRFLNDQNADASVHNRTDTRPGHRYRHALIDRAHGGHVPSGVTAHGSPSGPLQFDRLEAALGHQFPLKHRPKTFRAIRLDGSIIQKEVPCQTTRTKEPPSFTISPRTIIERQLCITARKITRLRTSTRKRRCNNRIRLTNGQKKLSSNQPIPTFEIICPGGLSEAFSIAFYRCIR